MVRPPWQDALNPQLTQRLLRPLVGVIPDTLAVAIFERSRRFKQRLSLLHQFQQRWGKQSTLQVPDIPIVYAQWVSPTDPATTAVLSPDVSHPVNHTHPVNHPSTQIEPSPRPSTAPSLPLPTHESASSAAPLVIQAKFASSTSHSPPAESALPVVKTSIFSTAADTRDRNPMESSPASNTSISTTSISQFSNTTPVPPAMSATATSATERGLSIITPATVMVNREPEPGQQSALLTSSSATASQTLVVFPESRSAFPTTMEPAIAVQRASLTPTPSERTPPEGSELPLVSSESIQHQPPPVSPSVPSLPRLAEQPLVKAERITPVPVSAQSAGFTQPLVFARPVSAASSRPTPELALMPSTLPHSPSAGIPGAQVQASTQSQSIPPPPSSTTATPPINLNRLTQQVERNLARKLTVERERRGQRTWH